MQGTHCWIYWGESYYSGSQGTMLHYVWFSLFAPGPVPQPAPCPLPPPSFVCPPMPHPVWIEKKKKKILICWFVVKFVCLEKGKRADSTHLDSKILKSSYTLKSSMSFNDVHGYYNMVSFLVHLANTSFQ